MRVFTYNQLNFYLNLLNFPNVIYMIINLTIINRLYVIFELFLYLNIKLKYDLT
jgi:hypothetical protein